MLKKPRPITSETKKRIEKLAQDVQDLASNDRYEYARQKAFKAAVRVHQVDFLETLDGCLKLALESDDFIITTGRAIEMLGRVEHFFDCMEKFFQRNQQMMKEQENAQSKSRP